MTVLPTYLFNKSASRKQVPKILKGHFWEKKNLEQVLISLVGLGAMDNFYPEKPETRA